MARARRQRQRTTASPKTQAKTTQNQQKKLGRGKRFSTGIDIGSFSVKIITMAGDDLNNIDIRKVTVVPLSDPEGAEYPEEKLNRQKEALKEAVKTHGKLEGRVVLGFPRDLVTIRYLTLPSSDIEELREMLLFDVERHVPFPMEDLVISFKVIERISDHESRIMMVCVLRREIKPYMDMCNELNIEVETIDVDIFSACAAYERMIPPEETVAIADFGRSSVKLGILHQGVILFSRSLPVNENRLLKGFNGAKSWNDLQGRITASGALHPHEQEHFSQWVDHLSMELLRSVSAFGSEHEGLKINRMILCGGAGYFPAGPPRGMNLRIKTNATIETPLNGELPASDQYKGTEMSTPVGLALRGLDKPENGVNLLPDEFVQNREARQRSTFRKNIALFVFLIFTLLAGAGFLAWHQKYKESSKMRVFYNDLAQDTNALNTMRSKINNVDEYLDKDQSVLVILRNIMNLFQGREVYISNITFTKRQSLEINGQVPNEDAFLALLDELGSALGDSIRITHNTNSKELELGSASKKEVLEFNMTCRLDWEDKRSRR